MKRLNVLRNIVILFFIYSGASYGAILNVGSDGALLGASGINVDGGLYDVSFQDGTCVSVFNGCDEISDFLFTDVDLSILAETALLEQVFVDSILGDFDTNPALTNGCSASRFCGITTPVGNAAPGIDTFFAAILRNDRLETFDREGTGQGFRFADFANNDFNTYAVWSGGQPSSVPIPSAILLFGSALVGFLGIRRKASNSASLSA